MKLKITIIGGCVLAIFLEATTFLHCGQPDVAGQKISHNVRVVNIEVPVRVYQGDRFVDNLAIDDFEVYEDGVRQNIEALYYIDKRDIQRKDEKASFTPDTNRSFYLFFVLYEYNPKLREAIRFFIESVLKQTDNLIVVTPRSSYEMQKDLLARTPKDKIVDRLIKIIRKDIQAGAGAYRSVLRDLKRMAGGPVSSIEDQMDQGWSEDGTKFGSAEEFLMQYKADMARLENLRTLDEKKLYEFSSLLKEKKGQKFVYLFYQREFMPQLDKQLFTAWEQNPILKPMLDDLFGLYNRTAIIDMGLLAKRFADASITFHFLYWSALPQDIALDQAKESSWDVFETFAALSKNTGGLATTSSNLAYLMDRAADASEKYYLIYYSPTNTASDQKFRTIRVKTKSGNYQVRHLSGYIAD
jgi:hypothetical protein